MGDKNLNIQLWDVPGHERFGGMTNVFYKYSHGALVVFDLARYILVHWFMDFRSVSMSGLCVAGHATLTYF